MIATSVADVAGAVLGGTILALLLGLWLRAVLRSASANGILAPVLVGFGLRLALMLVIHGVSLLRHEGGLMFLDDHTYLNVGMHLAEPWRRGAIIDPSAYNYAGTPMFGYQALMGGVFVLVDDILAGKLVNVLASTTAVLFAARLAGRIWGEQTTRRTAWIAALLPGMVWWAVPLMKEAVSAMLLTGCLLALLSIGRRGALSMVFAIGAALVITRPVAAVAMAVGSAGVGFVMLIRHRAEVDLRRFALRALAAVGLALIAVIVYAHGQLGGLVDTYSSTIDSMIGRYRQSGIDLVPVSVLKSLAAPYPWTFDRATHNWDMGLYPGMWAWYALYPLAALTLLRHRRRPEVVLLLVVILTYLTVNAFTSGYVFRQRSSIEPLLVVLAVGTLSSWRALGRAAMGAWAVVIVFAALQSHGDPVTIGAIAVLVGVTWQITRRLPDTPLAVTTPEPLRAALRAASAPQRWPRGVVRRLREAAPTFAEPGSSARHRSLIAGSLVLAVVLSAFVLPRISASGAPVGVFDTDLTKGVSPRAARTDGTVVRTLYGYVISAESGGSATIRLPLGDDVDGERVRLNLWAYGGGDVSTKVELLRARRVLDVVGRPGRWIGRPFDITDAIRGDAAHVRLRVTATNTGVTPALFLDKVQVVRARDDVRPRASTVLVTIWLAALALVAVVAARGRGRHLLLPVAVGVLAAVSWPDLLDAAYLPLPGPLGSLWDAARSGAWLGLDHGPVWGSFGAQPALAGQALHLLEPIVGSGAAGARTAGLLLAEAALGAVWWAGARVAGAWGGVTAGVGLLLIDGFRVDALVAPNVATLLFAGALYLIALHRFFAAPGRRRFTWLAAATALAVLAEPTLAVGGVVVLVTAGLTRLAPKDRLMALGIAAVVLVVLLAPTRLTIAQQDHGNLFQDVRDRATAARQHEFAARRPKAVGMTEYIVGEHSLRAVAGGVVTGVHDAVDAVGERSESGVLGLAVLLALLAGGVYMLLLPRLRWLLAAPVLITAPVLFLADRGAVGADAAAAFWVPALLVSAGAMLSALATLVRERPA
ncbi:MAG: hypothetical protein QOI80_2980 [Solirubrobacteraceae bacterium]|jgi:hypothetical protein|nr:hypothetical protein [Solirubrobacteraceae bacterium]